MKELGRARGFGIGWMGIRLVGGVGVGVVGIRFVNGGGVRVEDEERVFILMGEILVDGVVGGLLVGGILGGIMSRIW